MRRPVRCCLYLYNLCTGEVDALYARTAASKSGAASTGSSRTVYRHAKYHGVQVPIRVVPPPADRRPQLPLQVPPRFPPMAPPRRVHPPQWSQRPMTPVAVPSAPSAPSVLPSPVAPLSAQPPHTPVASHVLQVGQGIAAYV